MIYRWALLLRVLLLLVVTVPMGFSSEGVQNDPTIAGRTLLVSGNLRTQTSYIVSLLETCVERLAGQTEPTALRQCLMNSRLFSEIKLDVSDDRIDVTVEERWTLIPIPFFQASSGNSRKAGLFLLESNFLGRGMTVVLGGSTSNSGTNYFAMLSDPSLFFSKWQSTLTINRQMEQVLAYEGDADETDGFNENATTVTSGLGYKWHPVTLSGHVIRIVKDYGTYHEFERPENHSINRVGATVNYDQRDFKLYFSEGLHAKLNVQQDVYRSDDAPHATVGDIFASYQTEAINNQALQLTALGGKIYHASRGDELRIGGGRGLRGIDSRSAWVGGYTAAAFDYQIPIKSYASGTWTFAPFVDVGRLNHIAGQSLDKDFATFGLGTYFYLRQVALPGLGLECGYNNGYNGGFVSASVGLGM